MELEDLDDSSEDVKKPIRKLHTLKSIPIRSSAFLKVRHGKVLDYYRALDEISEGSSGVVLKVKNKENDNIYAVKSIYKSGLTTDESDRMFFEFETCKKLDHPNIIKFVEIIEDQHKFHVVSEYYSGGELFKRIIGFQYFSENSAAKIMHQVLSASMYSHSMGIVHRDIKPENILFQTEEEDSPIVIIDFGTSRPFRVGQKMKKLLGTPYYIAPEVIEGEYTEKCDVWSWGIMLYVLLWGFLPFAGDEQDEVFQAILKNELIFFSPEWDNISEDAKSLISQMLEKDPKQRISMKQWFNHEWVQSRYKNYVKDNPISRTCLENLKSLRASRKLEQAVLTFISSRLTTMEDKYELNRVFQDLDEDGNGMLTQEELMKGYKFLNMDLPSIEELMSMSDADWNGVIDYSEFITAAMDKQKMLSLDKLEATFRAFDIDGSGKIGIHELKEMMEGDMQLATDDDWFEVIAEADSNGDGELDFVEFKDLMLKLKN